VIVGLGLDVCDVGRIRRALEAPTGSRFRARIFTPAEQAYCEARRQTRFASYAARFAAKEAAMKALGTGWGEGVRWRDFEVVRDPSGPPRLVLHGRAAVLARRRRMVHWLLALTHEGQGAIAAVVVEDEQVVRAGAAAVGKARRRAAAAGSGRPRPRGRR
jgi:holo-[acyl-carrier protein] synthase